MFGIPGTGCVDCSVVNFIVAAGLYSQVIKIIIVNLGQGSPPLTIAVKCGEVMAGEQR